jgi:hypothetical protein
MKSRYESLDDYDYTIYEKNKILKIAFQISCDLLGKLEGVDFVALEISEIQKDPDKRSCDVHRP